MKTIIILAILLSASIVFADFLHDNRDLINREKERLEQNQKMTMMRLTAQSKQCRDSDCRRWYAAQKTDAKIFYKAKLRELLRHPEQYFYSKGEDAPDLKIQHNLYNQ